MDFRERILAAVSHEEPDRVPVMGLIMDPATVSKTLGKKPANFTGMLRKPLLRNMIPGLMNVNWFWNRFYYGNTAGALESAIKLGFDANWTIYYLFQLRKDTRSTTGWAWHDAYGRLWEMGVDEDSGMTVNYSRALCETEEQWESWIEQKSNLFETLIRNVADFHKKLVDDYGNRIMPIGFATPGIFENSWQPIGFVNFTKFIFQKPDFVKRVISFYTDLYIKNLEAVMKSGVEVVFGGDDFGHKTGPMLRPELIERFFGESYRRVTDLVHSRKRKYIHHSCGNIYQLLDRFIDWGFDGIVTLEPTAGMELGKVREQVGHKLVLIGNLDVAYLLVRGTRDEVEMAVRKAIKDAARGGGYILSSSHSHPLVDPTRLKWMVEAAHKYGKYPINI